jgi:mitogen-activated protein kinase kinase kinase
LAPWTDIYSSCALEMSMLVAQRATPRESQKPARMASDMSPRAVRFSHDENEQIQAESDMILNGNGSAGLVRPPAVNTDSEDSASSRETTEPDPTKLEEQDGLGSLERYIETASHHSGSMTSLVSSVSANGTSNGRHRTATDATVAYTNGTSSRVPAQRPTGPARTPSNTYQPHVQRRPGQGHAPPFTGSTSHSGPHARDGSRPRPIGTSTFRAQEKEYVRRLRQQDHNSDYFDPYAAAADQVDSDSEGETPSSEGPFDGLDQETNLFTNSEDLQPTDEDLKDPQNRERLEWYGMLEAVLTGDVVRQEKKRLIGSTEEQPGKSAQKAEIWIGIRSKICGRHLAVQRRMIEDARGNLDHVLGEIMNFSIAGESEAGKPPVDQVRDVVAKIEMAEGLYPSRTALVAHHKLAESEAYKETCSAVISWYNINEMINTELSILKKWVGNDELDFRRSKDKSPSGNGLTDESSFLDRLMKEEGLKSLHDDPEGDGKNLRKRSMLYGISRVIMKAKESLIHNAHAFAKRHLPPYIEELLTLISFPSRLIEEIVKVRLAYAKKMKDSAQQSAMMQVI